MTHSTRNKDVFRYVLVISMYLLHICIYIIYVLRICIVCSTQHVMWFKKMR